MLLNVTNHSTALWNTKQMRDAEERWGAVTDFPFPSVKPEWDDSRVEQAADELTEQIMACSPDAVLCQGEMTMAFALVCRLQKRGIPVYAACTNRTAEVELHPDGMIEKKSVFDYVCFRRYPVMFSERG